MSRRQASSSASWSRCPLLRRSSGPARLPSASSTAASAAVHSGVSSPPSFPAPRNVLASRRLRSSNPSSSSVSGRAVAWRILSNRPSRSRRSAPPSAASSRIWSAPSRCSAGSRSVHSQICRPHDSEIFAAARASRTAGWVVSRRIHLMASAAAPPVIWVCHFSQVRAEPWPSSSYPPWASNARSTRARAAVCSAAARSSARRQSACSAVVSDAASAAVRYWSPALIAESASPAVAGGAGGWPGRHIVGPPWGWGLVGRGVRSVVSIVSSMLSGGSDIPGASANS